MNFLYRRVEFNLLYFLSLFIKSIMIKSWLYQTRSMLFFGWLTREISELPKDITLLDTISIRE